MSNETESVADVLKEFRFDYTRQRGLIGDDGVDRLCTRIQAAHAREVGAQQAKIDALMFEYCPDEMTQEQLDEWAAHQKVIDRPTIQRLARAALTLTKKMNVMLDEATKRMEAKEKE